MPCQLSTRSLIPPLRFGAPWLAQIEDGAESLTEFFRSDAKLNRNGQRNS